jgi:hypothetical protein
MALFAIIATSVDDALGNNLFDVFRGADWFGLMARLLCECVEVLPFLPQPSGSTRPLQVPGLVVVCRCRPQRRRRACISLAKASG